MLWQFGQSNVSVYVYVYKFCLENVPCFILSGNLGEDIFNYTLTFSPQATHMPGSTNCLWVNSFPSLANHSHHLSP
jgi:hypothetical protein